MTVRAATLILAGLAVASAAAAQTTAYEPGFRVSGNNLQEMCIAPDAASQLSCVLYISGAADQVVLQGITEGHQLLCMPKEIVGSQMRDLVLAYLAKDPRNRNLPGSIYVYRSLIDAYPCKGAFSHLPTPP